MVVKDEKPQTDLLFLLAPSSTVLTSELTVTARECGRGDERDEKQDHSPSRQRS